MTKAELQQRPIKFRAWMPKENKWYTGGAIQLTAMLGNSFGLSEPNSKIIQIQQFTGLKDKNGKEIYEGDICKTRPKMELTVVEYINDMFHLKSTKYKNLTPGNYRLHTFVYNGDIEVIGNIYENKELLK